MWHADVRTPPSGLMCDEWYEFAMSGWNIDSNDPNRLFPLQDHIVDWYKHLLAHCIRRKSAEESSPVLEQPEDGVFKLDLHRLRKHDVRIARLQAKVIQFKVVAEFCKSLEMEAKVDESYLYSVAPGYQPDGETFESDNPPLSMSYFYVLIFFSIFEEYPYA